MSRGFLLLLVCRRLGKQERLGLEVVDEEKKNISTTTSKLVRSLSERRTTRFSMKIHVFLFLLEVLKISCLEEKRAYFAGRVFFQFVVVVGCQIRHSTAASNKAKEKDQT